MEGDAADRRRPDESSDDDDDESGMPAWSWEGVNCGLLDCSKHGDGSIYRGTHFWHRFYRVADNRETLLEPMMLSAPTDCQPNMWACKAHRGCAMMQIFSLKLAHCGAAIDGPVHLYGFLAVRDRLNPLRNYIFNRSREDPFVVGKHGGDSGLFIQMAGPKRGIEMRASVLIEYDMKIKRRGKQEDDLQLIDGAACFSELASLDRTVYTQRIGGDCGAVDICFALLRNAVEATIQVGVTQMCHSSGLDFSLSCSVSRLPPKIELFQGVIAEPGDVNRFVVAAVRGSALIVYLTVGQIGGSEIARQCYAFRAKAHGYDVQQFKFDFATILVKVSWSTLVPFRIAQGFM
ncbi:hypothetical protein HU200_049942 [Digitaria exilis]|uniref:DUF6598 domain-containing protein n=1 Tax=Digitaria exilis TaxID=1010633 RepID=A0A835E6F4_9POAL|nr:hypothetical protein HU200_049942 [Digitaria exilis]CAB3488958.1 unnamed protein product [Digitaria exilis]